MVFYNPGGPGLSATGSLQAFVDGAAADFAAQFDIVAVDPRGSGNSTRITCGNGTPPDGRHTVMPSNRAQLRKQLSIRDP